MDRTAGKSTFSYVHGNQLPLVLPTEVCSALGTKQPESTTAELTTNDDQMEVEGEAPPASVVSQKKQKILDWFVPANTDYIRNEVSDILSTLVYK